jgi:hypothetical protein
MKNCFSCNAKKPLSAFNKNKNNPDGLQTQCRDCFKHRRATNHYKAKHLITSAKHRSDVVTVTWEWVKEKLDNGFCELTGLPFDMNPQSSFSKNPYSPSIDRIDSKIREYTPENTRIVLHFVNQALNEYDQKTALPILKAMVGKIK